VAQRRLARSGLDRFARRYGWVSVEAALLHADRETASAMLASIAAVAAENPLLWPMSRAVSERLLVMGLRETIPQEAVTIVEPLGFVDSLSLMTGATVVIADNRDVQVQAAFIGVRCVMVGPAHADDPSGPTAQGAQADGAARAMAAHFLRVVRTEAVQTQA
jgi:UDP-N-acetylglucosamine 2-epimerase